MYVCICTITVALYLSVVKVIASLCILHCIAFSLPFIGTKDEYIYIYIYNKTSRGFVSIRWASCFLNSMYRLTQQRDRNGALEAFKCGFMASLLASLSNATGELNRRERHKAVGLVPGRYTEQQNRDKQSDAHVRAQPFKETFHRVYLALLLHDKFEARQASDSIIDTSK